MRSKLLFLFYEGQFSLKKIEAFALFRVCKIQFLFLFKTITKTPVSVCSVRRSKCIKLPSSHNLKCNVVTNDPQTLPIHIEILLNKISVTVTVYLHRIFSNFGFGWFVF